MEVSAFEAKVVQNNNNLFGIDTVVKEVGTIMDGAEYEVFHLSSFDPSGLATMVYVDAQDKNLKDYPMGSWLTYRNMLMKSLTIQLRMLIQR